MTEAGDSRLDLGTFDGAVLLFGGPYGNRHALDALFDAAANHGIPATRMICTGDLAAYAAEPEAVAQRLREAGTPVVMGNVEESLGFAADDCGCGFAEESSCNLLAARWYRYASTEVSDEIKVWMRDLPRRIDFSLNGGRFAVIHGAVSEINRFVFPATPDTDKAQELQRAGTDAVIGGHSGLPFNDIIDGRLWHNPGVIGLPANDGTPRVWYSVLTPEGDAIRIDLCPLDYDHGAASAAIHAADLPDEYADTLETGLWPSDDIMPPADRARRGQAIDPVSLLWHPQSLVPAAAD